MSDSAQEMKSELNTKSGFQKYLRSREYHKVTNGVYQHVKVACSCDLSYHISYFFPSQFVSDRTCGRTQFQSPPGTSSEAGRFCFVLTVYVNLTPSVDQRIFIEPPDLYINACLAARMHSHRLLRRKNG